MVKYMYLMKDKGTVYINAENINAENINPKNVNDGTSNESAQNEVSKVIQEVEKLDKLVDETKSVIYEISSIFPFQFFPDKLIIDGNKVTIIRRELFFKRIYPILFRDILTVRVDRSILFASMNFEVRRFAKNPRPIQYLSPKKANKARQYIIGLVQAKRAGIDLSHLTANQIRDRLEDIGKTEE